MIVQKDSIVTQRSSGKISDLKVGAVEGNDGMSSNTKLITMKITIDPANSSESHSSSASSFCATTGDRAAPTTRT